MGIRSYADTRDLARRRLPRFLFDYIDGGSFAEGTLRRNASDLDQMELRQRVLTGLPPIDLSCRLFGETWSMPVGLGPVGIAGLSARRGEVQAASAAARAEVPFALSTVSTCGLDEVAAAAAPPWFQLYMMRDRAFMLDLLQRARETGCRVLLFTVDVPIPAPRFRDFRTGLAGAPGWRGKLKRLPQILARPGWAWDVGLRGRPHLLGNLLPLLGKGGGLEDLQAWVVRNYDPGIGWADLDFVRENWDGPIVLKGVLDAADARTARSAGLDGIVVSNHGGRQLDSAPSAASALPRIADAVGQDMALLADGGVRSGLDVLRMLALGARMVLIGRAWNFALAAGGQHGVAQMLTTMEIELRAAMTLAGVPSVASATRDILVHPARYV